MIPTTTYIIGFLLYIFFSTTTFNFISKTDKKNQFFKLLGVYVYYTLIIAYWISIVDINGSSFEKIIQLFIYIFASSIFLYFYYKNIIEKGREKYFSQNYEKEE